MAMRITLRDVPDALHLRLKERARLERKSLQAFLLETLEKSVAKPSPAEWLERVRRHKAGSEPMGTARILAARDADRR